MHNFLFLNDIFFIRKIFNNSATCTLEQLYRAKEAIEHVLETKWFPQYIKVFTDDVVGNIHVININFV